MHALFAALPTLLALTLATPAPPELRREELMSALRQGGYTVILRHARTDRAFNEPRDYVPKTRAEQRNLSDDGVRDAALMGAVFRRYGINFAEVISSPMYRTVETAELAARAPDTTMVLRLIPPPPAQAALVKRAPKAGTNRLIVTHHFVIEMHVPGIKPGEIGESEAVVVRHVNDGVELVGRITLDDWRALANPPSVKTQASAAPAHPVPAGAPATPATPGSVTIPDTHAGHLAREYIAAFNSGDRARMKSYLEDWATPAPDRPIEQRLDTYERLFAEYGPLSAHMIVKSESTTLELVVRTKNSWMRLTIASTEAQPMRASSVTFASMTGGHP